ncbi:MAG: MarR family transcriptional regulator [Jatrophihabitans sp.]
MDRPEGTLALDDQLCFALYAASRAMTARYRPLLDQIGLTYPQYLVMLILWQDGPGTVNALGERLRLDSGTLSPLLSRMQKNGLVDRVRSPADERSIEIHLTDEGAALRHRAKTVPKQITDMLGEFDHQALKQELLDLESLLRLG